MTDKVTIEHIMANYRNSEVNPIKANPKNSINENNYSNFKPRVLPKLSRIYYIGRDLKHMLESEIEHAKNAHLYP